MQRVLASPPLAILVIPAQPQLAHDLLELPVHLAPFANTHEREEALLARAAQIRASLALGVLGEFPQAEQADEVGALVAKAAMEIVGLLLELARALPRILDVERGGDDEDLAEASQLGARHDHP